MPTTRLLCALIALSIAGTAQAQPAAERGEALVQRLCSGCHATGPTGSSKEPAAPPFRDLSQRYEPDALAAALTDAMLMEHPIMPEFRLPKADVQSIIQYLDTIQARQKG
jgi:cytochrome c